MTTENTEFDNNEGFQAENQQHEEPEQNDSDDQYQAEDDGADQEDQPEGNDQSDENDEGAQWGEDDTAKWARNRIKKVNRKVAELHETVDKLNAQNEELKEKLERGGNQTSRTTSQLPYGTALYNPYNGEQLQPNTQEYNLMYEEANKALAGEAPEQKPSKTDSQNSQKQSQTPVNYKLKENIETQVDKGQNEYSDFYHVLNNIGDATTGGRLICAAAELDDELGLEALYHLAKTNPLQLNKLKGISSEKQLIYAVGKLIDNHKGKKKGKRNFKSNAPAPTGKSPARSTAARSMENMSVKDMKAIEMQKYQKRYNRG